MTQNMATIAGRQLRPAFIRRPPFQMSGWPTMTREDAFAFSKNELCCRYWSHVTVTTMKVSNMHHMKVYENAFIFHYAKTCNTWCNEYFLSSGHFLCLSGLFLLTGLLTWAKIPCVSPGDLVTQYFGQTSSTRKLFVDFFNPGRWPKSPPVHICGKVTLHCTVSNPITNLRIEGWRSWMKCNISFISKKANLFDFLELQLQSFNKIIARYFCLPCARQLPRKHIRCISPLIHCLVKCFQKFGRRDLWNAEKHFYVHPPSPS